MSKTKTKKARITCGGFTVEQSVKANADAITKAKTAYQQMEALDFAKAAFDKNVTRARDFYTLSWTKGLTQEDRDFLLLCRDAHSHAAIGLAKAIWKVK